MFDTVPIGRILGRFGSDIDIMDNKLPMTFQQWLSCLLRVRFVFFCARARDVIKIYFLSPILSNFLYSNFIMFYIKFIYYMRIFSYKYIIKCERTRKFFKKLCYNLVFFMKASTLQILTWNDAFLLSMIFIKKWKNIKGSINF